MNDFENYTPYTLPTIDFVGGETQDLTFNTYFYKNKQPYALISADCNFSIVSFMNKTGQPLITKSMEVRTNDDGISNVLAVTLNPTDTVDLFGKYIYQIIIKDVSGDVEIPKQGLLYITNNINKSFIR